MSADTTNAVVPPPGRRGRRWFTRAAVLLRVVGAEMTRPITGVTGAVIIFFAVLGGLRVDTGVGAQGWANPFKTALTGNLYIAPLCVGAATLVAQDVARLGLGVWLDAMLGGRRRTTVLRAGGIFIWAMLGYALLTLIIAGRISVTGSPDPADLTLIALDIAVVIASICLGTAVGRLLRSRVVAPVLALAVFAVQFATSYLHGWRGRLAPVYADIYYPSYLQPHLALIGFQVLFVSALGAAALFLVSRRRLPFALPAAAVVVIAVFGIRATGAVPVEVRSAPSDPLCAHNATVSVCLRQADSFALQRSLTVLTGAVHSVSRFYRTPHHFTAPGINGTSQQNGLGIFIPPDPGASPGVYADNAVLAILPVMKCDNPDETPAQSNAISSTYLWTRIKVDAASVLGFEKESLRGLLAQPEAAQKRWVHRRLQTIASCP